MNHAVQRNAARLLARAGHHSGLNRALHAQRRWRRDHRIFIFNWHRLSDESAPRDQAVPAARFREQVLWIRQQMPITTLNEALRRNGQGMDSDLAVLTFDDGYADAFTLAWPILRKLEVPATFFLTTGLLDGTALWFDSAARALRALRSGAHATPLPPELVAVAQAASIEEGLEALKKLPADRREAALRTMEEAAGSARRGSQALSWDEVRQMREGGMEIGCHSATHPILAQLSAGEQAAEIRTARDRLRDELGIESTLFAYPNGRASDFNRDTIRLLREAGFEASCTTIRGSNDGTTNPFRLRRIGIGDDPPWMLEARMNGLTGEGMRRLAGRRA